MFAVGIKESRSSEERERFRSQKTLRSVGHTHRLPRAVGGSWLWAAPWKKCWLVHVSHMGGGKGGDADLCCKKIRKASTPFRAEKKNWGVL